MSTGLECLFFETENGKWVYVLERGNSHKNTLDWKENADVVGPFDTYEKASEHLGNNNANPGGWFTHTYTEQNERERKSYAELTSRAVAPIQKTSYPRQFGRF